MSKALLLILSLSLFSSLTWAEIKSVTVDAATVSAYTESGETRTIFGGYGGIIGNCATSSTTTVCDSCSAMGTLGSPAAAFCNPRSINQNLELTIQFVVDTVPTSSSVIATFDDKSITLITGTSTTLAAETLLTAKMTWGSLCAGAGITSDCTSGQFSKTLIVGVSDGSSSTVFSSKATFTVIFQKPVASTYVDNCLGDGELGTSDQGFCSFSIKAGDEKVFMKDLKRADIDQGGTAKFSALRVYYMQAASDFNSIPLSTAAATFKDLAIKDVSTVTSDLAGNAVDGLTNNLPYVFAIASVDQAGNVTNFFNPSDLAGNLAQFSATPSKVIGLLEKKECFIATAAYGSSWDANVEVLRSFKNKILLRSTWGQKFVEFYYHYSPAIADQIASSEFLKAGVRLVLTPWVWGAKAALFFAEQFQAGEAQVAQ